ncbi:MotA/TolQ/ExbB proton channel family protein [uncultured Draconibacterium sp.]|uniref:MotA/TolQ/ExbB proton channel family protein n=1 Tax=uncultured Draconibacterium sp. TaxID=1573823 RepID=UPI003216A72A
MIDLDKTSTGFGYMVEAYKIGGPYMFWITIFGLLALGLGVWKIVELVTGKKPNTRFLELIRMSGSLALAFGLFSQIVGIVQALEAIRAAADVSPQIVMGGAIVSFYAPVWGFIVFFIATVFYYVLKEIIQQKST